MDLNKLLWNTTAQTFETMCFMSCLEPDVTPDGESKLALRCWVPFVAVTEDVHLDCGSVVITAYGDVVQESLVNMTGDDGGSDAARQDALGEIANVICGATLSDYDDQIVYNLGKPTPLESVEPPFPDAAACLATAQVQFDGGYVEVVLFAPPKAD